MPERPKTSWRGKRRMLERMKKSWRGKRNEKSGHVVVPGAGVPCPRCGRPTQIREHARITEKHLAQPYYFTRWFRCLHGDCVTKSVMVEKFKVWRGDGDRAAG